MLSRLLTRSGHDSNRFWFCRCRDDKVSITITVHVSGADAGRIWQGQTLATLIRVSGDTSSEDLHPFGFGAAVDKCEIRVAVFVNVGDCYVFGALS